MYTVDQTTGDIVITGFEKGIGTSPYEGLYDMRCINPSSIPGEAPINFSTSSITPPAIVNATLVSASTIFNTITFTGATGLENGMAIVFSGGGLPGGITAGVPYWVSNVSGGTCQLDNSFAQVAPITITTNGSGTFSAYNMGTPKYFAKAKKSDGTVSYYMVDSNGYVWTNHLTTTSGFWEFTGNTTLAGATGNGLVYYEVSDNAVPTATIKGYLFVFRLGVVDYLETTVASNALSWTYGWKASDGTTGNTAAWLDNSSTNHFAFTAPDNRVYFCNGSNIGKFFQTNPTTIFNPTSTASFTYTNYNLLPINDKAQCLAPLGTNILIGAQSNIVYSWNTTSNLVSNYIPLPESLVAQMVTVNTNTYIFAGNRGNIYITNGSQANVYIKVPDHLSGVIEPYFAWGGATYQKNRLYFGVQATTNASGTGWVDGYGGLWCVDLSTQSIYIANRLSYGFYNNGSYASALLSIPAVQNNNPLGAGLFIGWFNGTGGGIDKTIATSYTGGQAYVVSDMIPIGTARKPDTPAQLEFKLASPLLSGESVELQIASSLANGTNPTFTSVKTTYGDGTLFSDNTDSINTQNLQWLLIKAILSSGTAATPSFCRLREIRVIRH